MVHYSKIINGFVRYVDDDLIGKMNGSLKAWCVGAVVALIARKGPEVFAKIRDEQIVQALGIIDGEMVDIDTIYAEVLKQAQRGTATVNIPIIGPVTYSDKDVDALYRCIVG